MSEPRRMLWSGGFDSTYLVLDAIRRGQAVEPYYILTADSWQKQQREREAIRRVKAALPSDLRRLIVKEPTDAPGISEVWRGYVRIDHDFRQRTNGWFSQQAAYMASVAEQIGEPIEMALVRGDHALDEPAQMVLREHGISSPLAHCSKFALLGSAKREGFDHLLRLTWSCEADNEDAVKGACGTCEPCRRRLLPQQVYA